jgi:hypothetical protein
MRELRSETRGTLRAKLRYTNQATGGHGDFSVIFGAEGERAGVPVEMIFEPSWWVRVSLRLDDSVDVPGDLSHDRAVSSRIDDICARALVPDLATN